MYIYRYNNNNNWEKKYKIKRREEKAEAHETNFILNLKLKKSITTFFFTHFY
jgi:hypothetical protein